MSKNKNEIKKTSKKLSKKKDDKKRNNIFINKTKKNKLIKKPKNKKVNFVYIIIALILVVIVVVGFLVFSNINNKNKEINYALRESTVLKNTNESQIDTYQYEEEPEGIEYTLYDFSNILEARGSNVSIENISNEGEKIYKCLIATSNGIYEEFSGETWMSPTVMNVKRYDGTEVLVSAKRMASNERIVYCDWYLDDKCYQVVSLEVDDIGDYLRAINNYILSR